MLTRIQVADLLGTADAIRFTDAERMRRRRSRVRAEGGVEHLRSLARKHSKAYRDRKRAASGSGK